MDKVLLISNANAGSVSARTKQVIVKALSADFKLEVADTARRDHAIELAHDAVDRDFDAVVAFGGDGTINEVAQGLVGTDVALGMIPGGSTNVLTRSVGVPRDPVDATAFVASHLRSGTRRRINVGGLRSSLVDGSSLDRYFLFTAGMGLDAEVVKRVEADPEAKRRRGEWFFLRNALAAGSGQYRNKDPWITLEVPGAAPNKVVVAVCCNGRPFTYFRRMPVDVCPEARLDAGLDFYGLPEVHLRTIPRLASALLLTRSHVRWKGATYVHDVESGTLTAAKPTPLQVDGDYIGEHTHIGLRLVPQALDLLV